MIDFLRRMAPAVPPTTTETTVAPPATPVPAPATTSYFEDSFEAPAAAPLSLDGGGTTPVDDATRFLESILPPSGPELLHLDAGWVPQGQGYDKGRGQVLTTYYHDDGGTLLSIQDKNDGTEKHTVLLGGKDGAEGPSHAGGVSTDGEYVYVADTEAIYVYTRDELVEAESEGAAAEPIDVMPVPGDTVDPNDPDTELVSSGSYMTVKGKYAYVGGYSENGDGKAGAVWRYEIDQKTGKLIEDSRQGPIRAPDQAQGIAVVDGALLFTTGKHELVYQPFDEQSFEADIDDRHDISNGLIDPYAQGVNIIDGEVWVTYESGSQKWDQEVDYPRRHIQRIPLNELDLEGAGLTVADF
jgi:hypothetical protein